MYRLEIRFVQVRTGEQLALATANLEISDRLATQDVGVAFPRVPIPAEGKYEFQIWANGMHLGAGTFTASYLGKRAEPSHPGNQLNGG